MAIQDRAARRPIAVGELERGEEWSSLSRGNRDFFDAAGRIPGAVFLADISGPVVYANQRHYQLTGGAGQSVAEDELAAYCGEAKEAGARLLRTIRAGTALRGHLPSEGGRDRGGTTWASVSPLTDQQGRVTHVLGIHMDSPEHERNEAASSGAWEDGISDHDSPGRFLTVAERDHTIVFNDNVQPGLDNRDVIGSGVRRYFPPEQAEIISARLMQVLKTGEATRYNILGAGPNGTLSHYVSRVEPLVVDGRIVAAVIASREGAYRDTVAGPAPIPTNSSTPASRAPVTQRTQANLSRRELEVLRLLASGRTNHEIAHRLGIRKRTVDHHVGHILAKLDAPNRTAAVFQAERAGLIGVPELDE